MNWNRAESRKYCLKCCGKNRLSTKKKRTEPKGTALFLMAKICPRLPGPPVRVFIQPQQDRAANTRITHGPHVRGVWYKGGLFRNFNSVKCLSTWDFSFFLIGVF